MDAHATGRTHKGRAFRGDPAQTQNWRGGRARGKPIANNSIQRGGWTGGGQASRGRGDSSLRGARGRGKSAIGNTASRGDGRKKFHSSPQQKGFSDGTGSSTYASGDESDALRVDMGPSGTENGSDTDGFNNNGVTMKQARVTKSDREKRFSTRSSIQSYYEELKTQRTVERRRLIAEGKIDDPDVPKPLSQAITFVGTCQDMCPEFERVTRTVQNGLDKLELGEDGKVSRHKAVKIFHRPAAGIEAPLPSDVRPPMVLIRTLEYLIEDIVGGPKPFEETHHFVRDRTRGIRQDFTYQNYRGAEAILCHEQIARFHIMSLHKRCESPNFDHYQEMEQLLKVLTSLAEFYNDTCRDNLADDTGYHPPNEAEFRAYQILARIRDPEMEHDTSHWPKAVSESEEVRHAMQFYQLVQRCNNDGDLDGFGQEAVQHLVGSFFNLVRSKKTTYLQASLLEVHFNDIRRAALKAMRHCYRQVKIFRLDRLVRLLGYESEDLAIRDCQAYGIRLGESEIARDVEVVGENGEKVVEKAIERFVYIDFDRYQIWTEPNPAVAHSFHSDLVESKLGNRTLPDILLNRKHTTSSKKTGPQASPPPKLNPRATEFTPASKSIAAAFTSTPIQKPIPATFSTTLESKPVAAAFGASATLDATSVLKPAAPAFGATQNTSPASVNSAFPAPTFGTQPFGSPSIDFSKSSVPNSGSAVREDNAQSSTFNPFKRNDGTAGKLAPAFSSSTTTTSPFSTAMPGSVTAAGTQPGVQDASSATFGTGHLNTRGQVASIDPSTAKGFSGPINGQNTLAATPGLLATQHSGKAPCASWFPETYAHGPVDSSPARSIFDELKPKPQVFDFSIPNQGKELENSITSSSEPFNPTPVPVPQRPGDQSPRSLFDRISKPEPPVLSSLPAQQIGSTPESGDQPQSSLFGHISEANQPIYNFSTPQKVDGSQEVNDRPQQSVFDHISEGTPFQNGTSGEPQDVHSAAAFELPAKNPRNAIDGPAASAVQAERENEEREKRLESFRQRVRARRARGVLWQLERLVSSRKAHMQPLEDMAVRQYRKKITEKAFYYWKKLEKYRRHKREGQRRRQNPQKFTLPVQFTPVAYVAGAHVKLSKIREIQEANWQSIPLYDIFAPRVQTAFKKMSKPQGDEWGLLFYNFNEADTDSEWFLNKFFGHTPSESTLSGPYPFKARFYSPHVQHCPPITVSDGSRTGGLVFGCSANFAIPAEERFRRDREQLHQVVQDLLKCTSFEKVVVTVVCYRSPLDDGPADVYGHDTRRASEDGRRARIDAIEKALAFTHLAKAVIAEVVLIENMHDLRELPSKMIRLARQIQQTLEPYNSKAKRKFISESPIDTTLPPPKRARQIAMPKSKQPRESLMIQKRKAYERKQEAALAAAVRKPNNRQYLKAHNITGIAYNRDKYPVGHGDLIGQTVLVTEKVRPTHIAAQSPESLKEFEKSNEEMNDILESAKAMFAAAELDEEGKRLIAQGYAMEDAAMSFY